MDLHVIWFLLLGALLAGYAILDGFDLGVGIIHMFHRRDIDRQTAVASIGPLWDGNEVWLVTFGGALFAAFPEAYATIFSAFYDTFMVLLFCLIMRAVSLELRHKFDSAAMRTFWDCGFFLSSLIATFLFGVATANGIIGLPLDERGNYQGHLFQLLQPFPVLVGALAVAAFAMHGTMFLYLKTDGELRARLENWIWTSWGIFLVLFFLASIYAAARIPRATANFETFWWAELIVALHILIVANIPRAAFKQKFGMAFLCSCINIACLVFLLGIALFPNLVAASNEPSHSLTIYNAASSVGTLKIMFIIAMLGMPMVLSYTILVYRTFHGKADPNLYVGHSSH